MALAATYSAPLLCRLPRSSRSLSAVRSSPSIPSTVTVRRRSMRIRSSSVSAPTPESLTPAISLSEKALNHLNKIRSEKNEDLCLRIGVKQGGCSGMSYTMDFEDRSNASPDDSFIEYNGFTIVCDPKSLLFLYGMQLDFSDALIGGGFSFKNPNATKTCSCGKSFGTGSAAVDQNENSNGQCV